MEQSLYEKSLSYQKLDQKNCEFENDFTWINFKSKEQEIDIEKSIKHYPKDQFSLQLNSFDMTNRKLKFIASEIRS